MSAFDDALARLLAFTQSEVEGLTAAQKTILDQKDQLDKIVADDAAKEQVDIANAVKAALDAAAAQINSATDTLTNPPAPVVTPPPVDTPPVDTPPVTPPVDTTPPPVDTPPVDTPPVTTPPVDTTPPPVDTPPVDTPPVDVPPVVTPPADSTPPVDTPPVTDPTPPAPVTTTGQ